MGLNVRKTYRIGKNTRINFSKGGGIGFSTGFKGFRISKNRYGLRLTIGRKGVYYTKWFTKKKKVKKVKKLGKTNKEEQKLIDPEVDFERVPTDDEKALYLYLGSKERNYLLSFLLIVLLLSGIYCFVKPDFLSYLISGVVSLILLYYLFFTKLHRFIFCLNRSIKLFTKNDFDKSYTLLQNCLLIKPQNIKVLILLIFTTFKLEKYEEALSHIDTYKKIEKPLEVMYFIEGFACTELGKYVEGIDAIEEIYSEEDDIKYAKYKLLGDCYLGLNKIDMAINWYEELPVNTNEMNEDLLEYKYALGKALYIKGHKKRAFNYLAKVYDYQVDYKDVKELMYNL
jgi:tetratricopeptide (TPR) repeat protein